MLFVTGTNLVEGLCTSSTTCVLVCSQSTGLNILTKIFKGRRRSIMCKKLLILTSFVLVFGLVSSAIGQPTGEILFEYWMDIGGTAISDLTGQATFPDNPDDGELRPSFDGPVDWADNYGAKASGYLYPPEDGDYTFWISGDDYQDLYLSTDDDPANAVLIAQVLGWTGHLAWNNYPEQQSAPVTLAAGGKYYIEALMKEGGGGDSCAAGWTGPGIGDEITVIDGAYLSPAEMSLGLQKARNPVPADGAVDADVALLEWTSGAKAVSHVVYLDGALLAETDMNLAAADLAPGMAYTWQVDEVQEDGTVIEGDVWSFTTLPLEAHFPSPEDGAEDVESATLTWTVGKNTIINDVYFGTDEALVAANDPSTFKGKLMTPSYDPGALELFTTYYWKVDEFSPTGTVAGPVWSFSTPKETIIDSGSQTLNYDNSAEPYVSELAYDVPADLTAEGVVSDLTLSFQGQPSNLSVDEATGTYQITGEGADVWGGSDQFHYVYMNLTGDGEISARVVSNGTGSNTWAKGGVMIRETNAPDSKHMIMGMTGGDGGGIAFQGRFADTGAASSGFHGDITAAPPYWVKLVREGNTITGYSSADGVEWAQFTDTSPDNSGGEISNPQPVEMADPVLIGLFVTSHADGENRTYTFDNVDIQGDVDGVLVSEDIDSVSGNSAEPIYVALDDAAGNSALVVYPFDGATQITTPRFWRIPLSEFAGVDPTAAAKLYVGVGDGEPGGAGAITISNIRVVKADMTAGIDSWKAAAEAASPGFIATNVSDGLYDIGTYGGEQTYEFVVKANPNETEPSMALIGRRQFGDTQAGLKFDQWNNTGEYGATLFGVVDLYYGVAATYGVATHAVFVSSEANSTTDLYVDGALAGSVDRAISMSGIVGIGYGAQGEDMSESFDNFDGDIYCVAIYDAALTAEQIAANADAFFNPVFDVTVAGDIVKGVPDDGDWPGGEPPAYAIDDNTGTKYLHFKGDFDPDPGTGGSGLQITPLGGSSVVTGLTLTTANDVPGRDPIAFELSGSNDSIDGPYELIAAGDVVDFAGEVEWPRFTKNATPIAFDNEVAYSHYQLIFTAIRGPVGGSVNSMQIAEVELLGVVVGEPVDVGPVNLLANGGFEDGVTDPWSTYGDATMEVVQDDPVEGDYCLHVTVNSAGANFWDAGLQNAGHVFEAGKSYTLSASLKAKEGTMNINFKPELAADPWTGFGDQEFTMTDTWAEYSVNTGVLDADVDPGSITFHIAYAPGEFYVDDVKFCED
jgi:hypothetical protein